MHDPKNAHESIKGVKVTPDGVNDFLQNKSIMFKSFDYTNVSITFTSDVHI